MNDAYKDAVERQLDQIKLDRQDTPSMSELHDRVIELAEAIHYARETLRNDMFDVRVKHALSHLDIDLPELDP